MYSSTSEEDRANRYSAEEERGRLLLVTTVDLGDGLTDKIELRAGDCPEVGSNSGTIERLFQLLTRTRRSCCINMHVQIAKVLLNAPHLIYRRQQQHSAKEMVFQTQ